MARSALSFRDRIAGPGRWVRARSERVLFPPTDDPARHWLRQAMNAAVDRWVRTIGPEHSSAAEISGRFHADRPWRSYESLEYPAFDLCAERVDRGPYDVVICEQVLEHVPDPCRAALNLHALLVPGGRAIVSTPFLVRIHELPEYGMGDYWRFTPRGLRALLERAGLEVEAMGSWGNRRSLLANLGGWSAYRRWHSLRNEPEIPLLVWALARRPHTVAGGRAEAR